MFHKLSHVLGGGDQINTGNNVLIIEYNLLIQSANNVLDVVFMTSEISNSIFCNLCMIQPQLITLKAEMIIMM